MIQTIMLEPKPPYNFELMVKRLQGVNHELYRYAEGYLLRTIRVNGKVYLIKVCSIGQLEQPKLEITIVPVSHAAFDLTEVVRHITKMFSVEVDLQPFYEHMAADPVLAGLCEKYRGLRFVLESDTFECMVKTIIGQQLNLAFAAVLNRRLIGCTSRETAFNGIECPIFPGAEQVAILHYDDLKKLQFSQRKAEYVIDFARAVVQGTINLDQLEQTENEEIIENLTKIRGIGRWTVECFLMFGLGRKNILPAADIGLRNALRKAYGLDYQPAEPQVRAIGAAWEPWSSYTTFYLWESLNEKAKI